MSNIKQKRALINFREMSSYSMDIALFRAFSTGKNKHVENIMEGLEDKINNALHWTIRGLFRRSFQIVYAKGVVEDIRFNLEAFEELFTGNDYIP